MLLVGCRLKHSGVGEDDSLILIAFRLAVDHDIVELSRIHVLLLYIYISLWNAIVEDAFRYLELRTLLLHRQHQLCEMHLRIRTNIVFEVERSSGDEQDDDYQRAERLYQRHSRCLYCRQLTALAEITECHQRCQQYSQRQGLWDEHQRHIPEELGQYLHRQSLADEVIDVFP